MARKKRICYPGAVYQASSRDKVSPHKDTGYHPNFVEYNQLSNELVQAYPQGLCIWKVVV